LRRVNHRIRTLHSDPAKYIDMSKNVVIILLGVVFILSVLYSFRVRAESETCQQAILQCKTAASKAQRDADTERDRLKDLVEYLNRQNQELMARLKECEK